MRRRETSATPSGWWPGPAKITPHLFKIALHLDKITPHPDQITHDLDQITLDMDQITLDFDEIILHPNERTLDLAKRADDPGRIGASAGIEREQKVGRKAENRRIFMPVYPRRKTDKDALYAATRAGIQRRIRTLAGLQTEDWGAWQVTTTDSEINLSDLTRGVEYDFRVLASNANGDSTASNVVTVVL